jgi:glutamine---fructose-6-phosphate transaminase (isomerizing)
MGGIVGIVSRTDIVAQLVNSMNRIPYNAGDTCGLATAHFATIDVRKDIGPLQVASQKRGFNLANGFIGIGHVGNLAQSRISRKNAQPHVSCDEKFAVVTDGVVANSERIRANLATNGRHFFFSETAAEVFGHLVEEAFRASRSVEEAFAHSLSETEGNFAVAVISNCESPRIFCAHKNGALLIGTEAKRTVVTSYKDAFQFDSTPSAVGPGKYAVLFDTGFAVETISQRHEKKLRPQLITS